jgi:hypothetical protein
MNIKSNKFIKLTNLIKWNPIKLDKLTYSVPLIANIKPIFKLKINTI